ncbi:clavesin-2-like [Daktulosphaira vitifoliae]|uniref:clavesin-2-like n=1 Tax=Daktulosphaira vitifoliae TaxID=58002 RepID=UPI0021A9F310|nr:clavesin-2-like [Daktulosphaira vitifoliae]XP_050549115.1 clavesin-2-like [Daktulosphaira vitifoliae]
MAEFVEYQPYHHTTSLVTHSYGVELFPQINSIVSAKKNSPEEALKKLKQLLRTKPWNVEYGYLTEPVNESILIKFLYARKMKENKALELIHNYHQFRKEHREWFYQLEPYDPKIQMALQDGFPSVLPNCDRKSRKIIFMVCSQWNTDRYCLLTIYRALILSLEHLVKNTHTQYNGFVIIVDWTNFTTRQTMNINPRILRIMLQGLQDCFPAKIKAVHFINQPWYIEGLMSVVKPFLKEKTKNKIIVHGLNLNTLHDHFPKDVLPSELGGELPPYDSRTWLKCLLESSLGVSL